MANWTIELPEEHWRTLYALAVSAPAPYRETRPVLAAFEARLTMAESAEKPVVKPDE